MSNTYLLDFDKPIALFPFDSVILYPQTVQHLHIFEQRYRQLVEDCIESSPSGKAQDGAPIAMAAGLWPAVPQLIATQSADLPSSSRIVCPSEHIGMDAPMVPSEQINSISATLPTLAAACNGDVPANTASTPGEMPASCIR